MLALHSRQGDPSKQPDPDNNGDEEQAWIGAAGTRYYVVTKLLGLLFGALAGIALKVL